MRTKPLVTFSRSKYIKKLIKFVFYLNMLQNQKSGVNKLVLSKIKSYSNNTSSTFLSYLVVIIFVWLITISICHFNEYFRVVWFRDKIIMKNLQCFRALKRPTPWRVKKMFKIRYNVYSLSALLRVITCGLIITIYVGYTLHRRQHIMHYNILRAHLCMIVWF